MARSFAAFLLLVGSGETASAETFTEGDVIRIAQTNAPDTLAARAATAVAEAEEVRAALYPNPSVAWEREHTPGRVTARERQDSFFVTVPVDFTGKRPAQKALARSGTSVARARAAGTQRQAVTASLEAFYDALAAEHEVRIATRAVARLDEAARVIGRRHDEGTSSGYERTRLEVEAELARSLLREAEMRARTARATLAVLLGVDTVTMELHGDFTTSDPSSGSTPTGPQRRSIVFLRTAEADARDAHRAAGWGWVPTLALSGGLLISETTDTRYGYVAGLSLSVPIFSWGQELRAESSARQQLLAAEVRSAERATRLEEVRAREQLVSARQEITRFSKATGERVDALERAVQSGYREGDRTVVELLDAQRARTNVDRRRLELEFFAKLAEIDLRAARGEFE